MLCFAWFKLKRESLVQLPLLFKNLTLSLISKFLFGKQAFVQVSGLAIVEQAGSGETLGGGHYRQGPAGNQSHHINDLH